MKTEPTINIQSEVVKIHSQFGMTEIANYRIEKLFEMYVKQSSPKIKQLEWNFYGLYYLAQTPFGRYTFEENEKNENVCDLRFGNLLLRNNIPVNEAKAAAQADFEKRIKECLE